MRYTEDSVRGMTHPFHPSTGRQRQADLCELMANLVYILSSRQPELHSETLSVLPTGSQPMLPPWGRERFGSGGLLNLWQYFCLRESW